ncbi:MAG TPA: M48 family metalloprotease, partial [Candidatus Acidoferrales bacterium]|nr:M48 family metalloprotease [Candidatus Acidoferrales bacterium]
MPQSLISLLLFTLVPLLVMARERAPDPTARAEQTEQEPSESKAPQSPDTTSVASSKDVQPPPKAQAFTFTQIDLDLLKQVDAFDRYTEEKGWVYNDSATTAYLEKVGLALTPKKTPENVKWRFRVLRDPDVNAFALPNGSIYVNSGLLSRMENEAQLAGVLAHEITHVTNRHTYLQYHSVRKKAVAVNIMIAAADAAY